MAAHLTGDLAMTTYRERRLLDGLYEAIRKSVMPVPSTESGACDICERGIEIGVQVVTLPAPHSSTFIICGDCFELYRLCPGPRPMV